MCCQNSKSRITGGLRVLFYALFFGDFIQSECFKIDNTISVKTYLIGFVLKRQTYVAEVYAPPGQQTSTLDRLVFEMELDNEPPPYMVADLTGERLCFAQNKKLTCIERLDSGQVGNCTFYAPSHSRIISINFPHPQTSKYELIYTRLYAYNEESFVAIHLFDSNSKSSTRIWEDRNIYEANIAVDTTNFFVFYEDIAHDKTWYVNLFRGSGARKFPQLYTRRTSQDNHRITTMAIDVRSGVLYNVEYDLFWIGTVRSWQYSNETNMSLILRERDIGPKSHMCFSASGKLFFTSQNSHGSFSINLKTLKEWAEYVPMQQNNSKFLFGTEIFRNQINTILDASCPNYCRVSVKESCICWCPSVKPLLTANKECEPVVFLAIEGSETQVRDTNSGIHTDWDWITKINLEDRKFIYNELEDRLCFPKLNNFTTKTGLWCFDRDPEKGQWIFSDPEADQYLQNVLYPVNQAANTIDIYWMAEAENEMQSLWAVEKEMAKNMQVYVKEPKHVAVDSFRQILFWCTEINGIVQLRWQAFNRTGKKPDCFERQVFGAINCNGLAVSQVQTKVFILSQDTIYQATYEELQKERRIKNRKYVFRDLPAAKLITDFSYRNGYLIWIVTFRSYPIVATFRINEDNASLSIIPDKIFRFDELTSKIQVLLPQSETVESRDQCEGLLVNFAGICPSQVSEELDPPGTCELELDPPDRLTTSVPSIQMDTDAPSEKNQLSSTTSEDDEYGWWRYLTGGVGGAVFIAFLITLNIFACRRSKSEDQIHAQQAAVNTFVAGNEALARKSSSDAQRALHLPFESIIPPNSLQLSDTALGEGNFGIVCRGKYDGREVAVKTVKNSQDCNVIVDFLKELKIMAYVGIHENIVEFFGAEISEARSGLVHVVLELCPHGSLESFVRKFHFVETMLTSEFEKMEPCLSKMEAKNYELPTSSDSDETTDAKTTCLDVIAPAQASSASVSLNQLMKWSQQIAAGMNYLEQKNVVHGDLATRNVLVCEDLSVKISDFGFSKNMYQSETYRKKKVCPLPWRWASPETLSRLEFSFKAGVWSYGVTVWEIFSLGAVPYPDLTWDNDFLKRIQQGLRPPEPEHMPRELANSNS